MARQLVDSALLAIHHADSRSALQTCVSKRLNSVPQRLGGDDVSRDRLAHPLRTPPRSGCRPISLRLLRTIRTGAWTRARRLPRGRRHPALAPPAGTARLVLADRGAIRAPMASRSSAASSKRYLSNSAPSGGPREQKVHPRGGRLPQPEAQARRRSPEDREQLASVVEQILRFERRAGSGAARRPRRRRRRAPLGARRDARGRSSRAAARMWCPTRQHRPSPGGAASLLEHGPEIVVHEPCDGIPARGATTARLPCERRDAPVCRHGLQPLRCGLGASASA